MPEPMSLSPTPRDQATSVRLATIAASQWGVVNHSQLRACGVGKSTISRWTAEGRLHRIHPGVYAVGQPAVPIEGRLTAALFAAGSGATLSHGTAAWWWSLIEEAPSVVTIAVPTRRRPPPGLRFHHPDRIHRTWHRRLPVTSVAQTLLDFAASAPLARVRRALAEGEFRDLVDLNTVAAILGRGRPGSAKLRLAIERHRPELALTRSELERQFLALCESGGLPLPEVNATICGLTVDACWRQQRVIVELDGYRAHRTKAQIQRDHERDLILRQAGHSVLRYTWRQVERHRQEVLADLGRALGRAD